MKKTLKIIGISLASLLGLVLVVAGVAIAMVSSSGQLTKMVRKYAPKFITCEMQLEKTDLTFFKTFPEVGVDIKKAAFINPMEGSASDTLADVGNLIVVVDARKLLKEKEIVIRKCILEDAFVNLYVDSLGRNNFNVFNTAKEDKETDSSFDYSVDLEGVKLKNTTLLYADDSNGMAAQVKGLNLDLKGSMQDKDIDANLTLASDDLSLEMKAVQLATKGLHLAFEGDIADMDQVNGTLRLSTPDISLDLGESYLENDTLDLNLPLQLNLSTKQLHLGQSQIGLNAYQIQLGGDAEIKQNKDIDLDIDLKTNTLIIEDVLTYLPQKVQKSLSSIEYSGKLSINEGTVKGVFNDSLMPLISAKVTTDKARVNIKSLPHPFTEVDLDADVNLDLNSKANSVTIHSLKTKFNRSNLSADGVVDDLLGDIGLKVKVKGDVPMSDVMAFMPKSIKLGGRTNLNLTTRFTVKQLLKSLKDYNLNRLSARADLKIKDFAFDMDTLHVVAPSLGAQLVLPALAKDKNKKGAFVALAASQLNVGMGKALRADLTDADIKLAADNLKESIEKMLLDAALNYSKLDLVYDTVDVHIGTSAIAFATMPGKNPTGLKARIAFEGANVAAAMGKDYALNSDLLKVNASIAQNRNKKDFLNQWNPDADFELGNAVLRMSALDEAIRIDNIDFVYNANELEFKKSTFRIGQSDISLQGEVVGIKEWMEDKKNLMKGELQASSEMLNINEILDLTSGLGASSAENTEKTAADPFIVPVGVDFRFILHTNKALFDNFDLNNLTGALTVKDGTLILEEFGFTNKAAVMQLTAMYQSPRKNNLFLAMDFHLLDVQINDLLHMIPYIDTLVPMLKTFDGQAEFHIGAETYLKANYEPKISTLRAAADIEGKNLSVNDKFTFTKITDMLDVSTNGSYRVDSLDLQLTVFKNEIDLWPSQIAIGKYKVTVDGRMTLDNNGDYHLSVTESPLPTRIGLSISGPLNHLDYKLEKPKFPTLYKPKKRSDTEQMYFELKKKIADRLKENVK